MGKERLHVSWSPFIIFFFIGIVKIEGADALCLVAL